MRPNNRSTRITEFSAAVDTRFANNSSSMRIDLSVESSRRIRSFEIDNHTRIRVIRANRNGRFECSSDCLVLLKRPEHREISSVVEPSRVVSFRMYTFDLVPMRPSRRARQDEN